RLRSRASVLDCARDVPGAGVVRPFLFWPIYIRYGRAGFGLVAHLVWTGIPCAVRRHVARAHAGRDRSARSPAPVATAVAHPGSALWAGPARHRAGAAGLRRHRRGPVTLPDRRG